MTNIEYRSLRDMNKCVVDHLDRLPRDIDLVVGVPRSGMLSAMMIALYLDVPVTDVEGLIEGRLIKGGDRTKLLRHDGLRRALVIDDSAYTGNQMREVRQRFSDANVQYDLTFACVYARQDRVADFDVVFEVIDGNRWIFEWNKLNHGMVPSMCVDMDGVLCRDPLPDEDDDGERYRAFLEHAEPKFRPRRRVGWIVTSRLEKYRDITEQWLAQHSVEYGELLMMDLPSLSHRTSMLSSAHKAKVYRDTPSSLFLESTLGQARHICRLSGRPVLCTQNSELILPTMVQEMVGRVRRLPNWFSRRWRLDATRAKSLIARAPGQ